MPRTMALLCAVTLVILVDRGHPQESTTKNEPKKQSMPNSPAPLDKTTDAEGEPLPVGAIARLGSTRWRHGSNIVGSTLSHDGKRLATASTESVAICDLATGKTLFRFPDELPKEPTGTVGYYCEPGIVSFSPDDKWLGSPFPNTAGVWSLENGRPFLRINVTNDRRTGGFTPDSKKFILAHRDETQSWDLTNGKLIGKMPIKDVGAISMDARNYVAWNEIHNLETGFPIMKFAVKPEHCNIVFAPNSKTIVLVDNDWKDMEIWDIGAAKPRLSLRLPKSATGRYVNSNEKYLGYSVQFSSDSEQLIMGTVGCMIHRWDLATKKKLPILGKVPGQPVSVHTLPDGKTLVFTEQNGLIRRWDMTTNRELGDPGNYQGTTSAVLSSDGSLAAINDYRGRVDLWDMRKVKFLRTLRQAGTTVTSQAFAPDGKTLAVGLEDGEGAIYDVASGRETRTIRWKKKGQNTIFDSAITSLQFSPDGRSLCAYCISGDLWMRDLVTEKTRWSMEGVGFGWPCCGRFTALSTDGNTLAVVLGKKLAIVDAITGKKWSEITLNIDEREVRPGTITAIALAPDGRRLAARLSEGTLASIDIETGTEMFRVPDEIWARSLSYSRDGYLLALSSGDTVCVKESLSGREVLRLNGHREAVSAIAFAGDGRRLLSCGDDSQVYLWTLRPKSLTRTKRRLESIWLDLCAEDAPSAYRAIWEFCDDPGSVEFLRAKIVRVPPTDQTRLNGLVGDLDNANFRTREAATKDLSMLGDRATAALKKALTKSPSLEAQRRINELLRMLEETKRRVPPQQVRAVHAMELAATPETLRLLQYWSEGAEGSHLTEISRTAIRRLKSGQ